MIRESISDRIICMRTSIPGYEGRYEADSDGYIISLLGVKPRVLKHHEGRGSNKHFRVGLWKDGKEKTHTVHSLVMLAFRGPAPEGLEVRHLDGDHRNNALSNLQYGTRSENTLDQVDHYVHNNYSKAYCKRGHLFDEDNTIIRSDGNRRCRACLKAAQDRYHEKNYKPRERQIKTHCKYGHPLSGDNLRTYDREGYEMRVCVACQNRRNAERRSR